MDLTDVITAKAAAFMDVKVFLCHFTGWFHFPFSRLMKVRLCLSRMQPGSESVFEVWLPGRLPTEGNRGSAEVSVGGGAGQKEATPRSHSRLQQQNE